VLNVFMDAERWKRVDELLQAALRAPTEQQEEFLRRQCGGDSDLLEEVRSLLTSHRKAGSFLESPGLHVAVAPVPETCRPPFDILQVTAPYELGQPLQMGPATLYPVYLRGETYLQLGQASRAATEFQKLLDHPGCVMNFILASLAHLGVARANALQAKTSQGADADAARVRALAAYKNFFTL
jgi:hypothetical protein